MCANERQRDLWIGGMALHGLIDVDDYARDPTLRSLVMVVPFGLPDGPPPAPTGALRRRSRRSAPDDRVLVWGGGVWGWLDPLTPMRRSSGCPATAPRAARRSAGPGSRRAGRPRPAREAVAAARRAGLLGRRVHVNEGWVPYAERGALARGGRPRRQRPPRPRRGALRAPHAGPRLPLGGPAGRRHRAATRSPSWSSASGLGALAEPGDVAGFAGGVRADARARRRRRPRADRRASRRRCAGSAVARAARRVVRARRRRAGRSAAAPCAARRSAQYRWALAETLGDGGPARRRWPRRPAPAPGGAAAMRRLDRVELAALAALCGLSVLVLAALLTKGRALTGADGLLASDQLQYFTWIRQAGEHGLIGNEYDLAPDHRVFLHPGFLVSGLLHAATGITVPLSYLLWKPVAVALLFWGVLRYARRLLPPGGPRHAALLLGLFAVMPASALVAWTGLGRQAAPVHVRLHRGRAGLRAVPVGLPDDRDRRRR